MHVRASVDKKLIVPFFVISQNRRDLTIITMVIARKVTTSWNVYLYA